jgi:hypothetical protein
MRTTEVDFYGELVMNNKGQAILSEYVMIFFVVIAAAVAMTTFIQRSLEARIHDARDFMIDTVTNSGACDANCMNAAGLAGNQIPYEYEPYYTVTMSGVQQNQQDTTSAMPGNAQVIGAIYNKSMNENSQSGSFDCQLPPECNNPNNASECECQCPSTCP